jgi:hypothetical protein
MAVVLSQRDIECYVHMWRYAGHVLGICDELLPKTLEDQEEFMLSSMIHQGAPDAIPGAKTKEFMDAFAQKASHGTRGVVSFERIQDFLYQMTRFLVGNDYTTGMEIEDLGNWHWSVCLVRTLGFSFGTVLPRLPFGETLLFNSHTKQVRAQLNKRGTPIGHAAGSGQNIAASPVRSKL